MQLFRYSFIRQCAFMMSTIVVFSSCHESLEDRAAREAAEYTRKYCPTPVVNNTRTDSVVFNKQSKTYTYYCSFTDKFDDAKVIQANSKSITDGLLSAIKDNPGIKIYKEAGFSFQYIVHSAQAPGKVLYQHNFTSKEYQ